MDSVTALHVMFRRPRPQRARSSQPHALTVKEAAEQMCKTEKVTRTLFAIAEAVFQNDALVQFLQVSWSKAADVSAQMNPPLTGITAPAFAELNPHSEFREGASRKLAQSRRSRTPSRPRRTARAAPRSCA